METNERKNMHPRSVTEIERWTGIIAKCGNKGIQRLCAYLCSQSLGRDFMEPSDVFFARKGLTEFSDWAKQHTSKVVWP